MANSYVVYNDTKKTYNNVFYETVAEAKESVERTVNWAAECEYSIHKVVRVANTIPRKKFNWADLT